MTSTAEDVFKATSQALDILEKSYRRKNKGNSCSSKDKLLVSYSSRLALSCSSGSSSVFIDSHHDLASSNANHHYSNDEEFQRTIEANATVIEMYKYFIEKLENGLFQDKEELQKFKAYFADIMYPSNINVTIEKMKTVILHFNIISVEKAKLKHVLRSSIADEVWKINKDYHKTVINFFNLASEIVKNIDEFVASLESIKEFQPDRLNTLKDQEVKAFAVLQESMDDLNEFRSFIKQQPLKLTSKNL